jgi:hypothetical protein
MRNFRQALASPHPVLIHRVGAVRNSFGGPMTQKLARFVAIVGLAVTVPACALSLRNPDIVDLQRHPGRYQDRTVSISGVVTQSWGVPLVPFKMYKVDDGTGQVTVLSQGLRTPATGEHVRVRGKVQDVATFGGRALGLHIREDTLYVKRD